MEQIKLSHIMGIMAGIGLGLIFGGMVGYVSKGTALKQEQKRREFKQLQKEKLELEEYVSEILDNICFALNLKKETLSLNLKMEEE